MAAGGIGGFMVLTFEIRSTSHLSALNSIIHFFSQSCSLSSFFLFLSAATEEVLGPRKCVAAHSVMVEFRSRRLCGTLSKALEKSGTMASIC